MHAHENVPQKPKHICSVGLSMRSTEQEITRTRLPHTHTLSHTLSIGSCVTVKFRDKEKQNAVGRRRLQDPKVSFHKSRWFAWVKQRVCSAQGWTSARMLDNQMGPGKELIRRRRRCEAALGSQKIQERNQRRVGRRWSSPGSVNGVN